MKHTACSWTVGLALAAGCGASEGPAGPGATALDPVTGNAQLSDGGAEAAATGPSERAPSGLPCEVANLLATHCTTCHSNPPITGVPMALVSDADLRAMSKSAPTKSVAELCLERMHDTSSPMPPGASTLSEATIAPFSAWVNAGMKSGSCGDTIVSPFDVPPMCSSQRFWTRGDHESPLMHPGVACIDCHKRGNSEGERGPAFAFAGTVFPSAHEPDDCNGASGKLSEVLIEVIDKNQRTWRATANEVGNFFLESRSTPAFPITARVTYQGRVREMTTGVSSSDCNSCHTQSGTMDAPGRIILP